jgi:hypothetical protein
MKALLFSGLIGAAISGAVVQPSAVTDVFGNADSIVDLYNRIFPGDPLKQEALDLCFRQDHAFNRLFGSERSACYAKFLPSQLAGARPGAATRRRTMSARSSRRRRSRIRPPPGSRRRLCGGRPPTAAAPPGR